MGDFFKCLSAIFPKPEKGEHLDKEIRDHLSKAYMMKYKNNPDLSEVERSGWMVDIVKGIADAEEGMRRLVLNEAVVGMGKVRAPIITPEKRQVMLEDFLKQGIKHPYPGEGKYSKEEWGAFVKERVGEAEEGQFEPFAYTEFDKRNMPDPKIKSIADSYTRIKAGIETDVIFLTSEEGAKRLGYGLKPKTLGEEIVPFSVPSLGQEPLFAVPSKITIRWGSDQLIKWLKQSVGEDVLLKDVIVWDKAFKAEPKLNETRIKLLSDEQSRRFYGLYSLYGGGGFEKNTIYLNKNATDQILATKIHETAHALQGLGTTPWTGGYVHITPQHFKDYIDAASDAKKLIAGEIDWIDNRIDPRTKLLAKYSTLESLTELQENLFAAFKFWESFPEDAKYDLSKLIAGERFAYASEASALRPMGVQGFLQEAFKPINSEIFGEQLSRTLFYRSKRSNFVSYKMPPKTPNETAVYANWLWNYIPFIADKIGIKPKGFVEARDMSKLQHYTMFPETVLREFAGVKGVKGFVNANLFHRQRAISKAFVESEHYNNLLRRQKPEEVDRGLWWYAKIGNQQSKTLPPEFLKEPIGVRRVYEIADRAMRNIRERYVKGKQDELVEIVKSKKQLDAIPLIRELKWEKIKDEKIRFEVERLKEIGDVLNYMPQVREGKWTVGIGDGEGKSYYDQSFDSTYEAALFKRRMEEGLTIGDYAPIREWFGRLDREIPEKYLAELNAKRPELKVYVRENKALPPEARFDVPLTKSYAIIKEIAQKGGYDKTEFEEALLSDMMEWQYQQGFKRHQLQRQKVGGEWIPGYEIEPLKMQKSMYEYIQGHYYAEGKMVAAREMAKGMAEVVTQKPYRTELIRWMGEYADKTMSPALAAERYARFLARYFLFGKVVSVLRNGTQNFISGAASYIHNEIPLRELWRAMMDVPVKRLTPVEKRAMTMLFDEGEGQALMLEEMWGGKLSSKKFWDIGLIPFQGAEVYVNRLPAFLGAFRHFYKETKHFDMAFDKGLEVMREGHYLASRFNRPMIINNNVGRIASSLQTFTMHYLKQAKHYMDEGDYKAFIYLLGMPMVLGGLVAMPGGQLAVEGVKKVYKEVLGHELMLDIEKVDNERFEGLIKNGLFGMIEMSGMSQGLGVGISEDPIRSIVAVNLVKQVEKSIQLAREGQGWLAFEQLMPGGIKDAARAVRETSEGVVSGSGTPMLDVSGREVKLTPSEGVKRGIGILPERVVDIYGMKDVEGDIKKERHAHLAEMRNEWVKGNHVEAMDLWRGWNSRIRKKLARERNMMEIRRLRMLLITRDELDKSVKAKQRAGELEGVMK